MKLIIICVSMLSLVLLTGDLGATDKYSVGVGVGLAYSGVGANFSKTSKNDMIYASAGCVSFSSRNGSTCGGGLGWINTQFLDSRLGNHGLGVYAGIIGTENEPDGDKAIYGLGLGYYYFFNGINNSGTNIGISYVSGKSSGQNTNSVILQLGYQF